MNLREATAADREFAFLTKKAAFRTCVEAVWGWNEAEQRQLHERRFAEQKFQVIQIQGTDVGVLATVRGPDCVKINQLFILPEYQGRGIGKACMTQVLADAKRDGFRVRLRVLKVNSRAAVFFCRLGFRQTGDCGTHIEMERLP